MFFNPLEVGMKPPPFKHTVYNALVVPRPIGWISTLGEDGVIDVKKINPLARLGYLDYATLDFDNMFSLRPPGGDARFKPR